MSPDPLEAVRAMADKLRSDEPEYSVRRSDLHAAGAALLALADEVEAARRTIDLCERAHLDVGLRDEVEALRARCESLTDDAMCSDAAAREAEAEVEALRARLAEAVTEMRDMVQYVPDYFRAKWGYDAMIDRLAAATPDGRDAP